MFSVLPEREQVVKYLRGWGKYKLNSLFQCFVKAALWDQCLLNPKFEFKSLGQTMDPNVSKLQVIQNDMMRLLIGKKKRQPHKYGETKTAAENDVCESAQCLSCCN